MVKYGGGGLLVFFEPLTKGPRGLSYIFFITLHPTTFITVEDPTFLHHGVPVFWVHQEVLDGRPSLEVYLHTKVTAFFLDTFTQPLIVWNSYIWFRSVVLLSVLVLLFGGWVVHLNSDPVQSPSGVVAVPSALFKWSSSCCKPWLLEFMVLGLW